MPTILDSFFVQFGILSDDYGKGAEEIRRQNRRIRDEEGKTATASQTGSKRSVEALGKVKNEVLGLALAFAGAASVKSFIANILNGDAATGRLAANLGVATSELSAWQLVARQAGGTAKDADTAFNGLAMAAADYRLGIRNSVTDAANGFNLGIEDLEHPGQALMKIAKQSEHMSRAVFTDRARNMGLPDSLITTLAKGGAATRVLVDQMERLYAVQKPNADAAAALDASFAKLREELETKARPAIYAVADGVLQLTQNADAMDTVLPVAAGLLGALAIEALAVAAPFLLTAAAIAVVVKGLESLRNAKVSAPDPKQSYWERFKHFLATGEMPKHDAIVRPGATAAAAPQAAAPAEDATYLKRAGLSDAQVAGVLAGMKAEGGGEGMAANGAFGIGQWRGPRLAALRKRYGAAPTRQEQLEFLVGELKGGDRGGKAVLSTSSPAAALEAYIRAFMRPGPGVGGDLGRGYRALGIPRPGVTAAGGGSSSTSSVTIGTLNIQTAATDAAGIAAELPGAIKARMSTASANRGLD